MQPERSNLKSVPSVATAPPKAAAETPTSTPVAANEGFFIDKKRSEVASAPSTEEEAPDMKEYLQKMDEQRKKREEVLRMKEERRRQQLAASASLGDNTNTSGT